MRPTTNLRHLLGVAAPKGPCFLIDCFKKRQQHLALCRLRGLGAHFWAVVTQLQGHLRGLKEESSFPILITAGLKSLTVSG